MATRDQLLSYLTLPQVRAALDTIAWAEGANYNTLYGGGTFSGNQHPNRAITAGGHTSTAAGRYQFLYTTWHGLGLPDFSPQNQDLGALMLIDHRGALGQIVNGDFQGALQSSALGKEWASLPYSPYGQTIRTESQVMDYYNGALAVYGGQTSSGYLPPTGDAPITSGLGSITAYLPYALGFVFLFLLIDD